MATKNKTHEYNIVLKYLSFCFVIILILLQNLVGIVSGVSRGQIPLFHYYRYIDG